MGKEEYDLSEMFIVRHNYVNRLRDNYLRRGKGNLGQGSTFAQCHERYQGAWTASRRGHIKESTTTQPAHNHGEFNRFINAIAQVPVEAKRESAEYKKLVNSLLDIYLGPVPETFTYKGKSYTAKYRLLQSLVSIPTTMLKSPPSHTSLSTLKAPLEVPDNWAHGQFYNVPIDEITEIMDYALKNGYTVNWDGDVSEKGFSHAKGVAINPNVAAPIDDYSTTDRARFEKLNPAEAT
jgi:hypothetical protein